MRNRVKKSFILPNFTQYRSALNFCLILVFFFRLEYHSFWLGKHTQTKINKIKRFSAFWLRGTYHGEERTISLKVPVFLGGFPWNIHNISEFEMYVRQHIYVRRHINESGKYHLVIRIKSNEYNASRRIITIDVTQQNVLSCSFSLSACEFMPCFIHTCRSV